MQVDVNAVIGAGGVIIAIASFVVAYRVSMRDDKKECAVEGKEAGELKADTDYIRRRVDDVLLEQREINRKMDAHSERITRVEESDKSAHKRIDGLERLFNDMREVK